LNDFPTAERLQWHGHDPGTPDWSETSRFVAFTLVCFLTATSMSLLAVILSGHVIEQEKRNIRSGYAFKTCDHFECGHNHQTRAS
jgi:hypothetical protein